jgi:hypothetical protein
MATIQLNTTIDQETYDNAGKGFDPIPAGSYEAYLHEIDVEYVKQGKYEGKPRLSITFKIAEGETAPDGTDVSGRYLWHRVNCFEVWSDKHNKFFPPFELLDLGKALGKTPEEISNIDTDEWQGESVQVVVKQVPKQEKDETTGKYVNIKPAAKDGKYTPDELKNEIARFRSLESAATSVAAKGKTSKTVAKGLKL